MQSKLNTPTLRAGPRFAFSCQILLRHFPTSKSLIPGKPTGSFSAKFVSLILTNRTSCFRSYLFLLKCVLTWLFFLSERLYVYIMIYFMCSKFEPYKMESDFLSMQDILSVCFRRIERLQIVSRTNVDLHMQRTKIKIKIFMIMYI